MSDRERLIYSIIAFLKNELSLLTPEACESMEVAIQCLENAYEVHDTHMNLDIGTPLLSLFSEHVSKLKPRAITPAEQAQAEVLKTEGNELMKQEKYEEALICYSKAIKLDGNNPVYFCNRAAAYSRLLNHEEAIKDCKAAIKIDPSYSKAYGRLGLAYSCLNRFKEAKISYKHALDLEPDNQTYKNNLELNEEELKNQPAAPVNVNRVPGAIDLNSMLGNSDLMSMATQLLSDPSMQNMMGSILQGSANETPNGMEALITAGQRLAQHMQSSNPELIETLRRQMAPGGNPPPGPQPE